ncbi:Xaa-Pro dipeptidyl-peptidase [Labedaea rhizosphaerae]|uniref:Xaa-Pro dipeptidyl-peptidase n=1 Tax=Labedaea rhizosphaerae TaxID=598644 RepID=UPI001AAD74BC|nr:Xaa-Pro dipeptidyl-peptidase [Labedaea rhizosphaerae]
MLLLGATLVSGFAQVGDAGKAQPKASEPVYDYKHAVRETVWVDIGLDEDRDGKNDRVAADIIRPEEAAERGVKVPVIMDASPYYRCCGRGNESQKKQYSDGKPTDFPLFYDNYFVPRGYAVVQVDLAGTNRSTGCTDVGGPSDIASAKAVIDWLNGRATAYTNVAGNTRAQASWATGKVGMIGKSWDGTIANGVAATGVDGLETIVPISAISSWYDYYRASGAPFLDGPATLTNIDEAARRTRCKQVDDAIGRGARPDGNYNAMWAQRDYVAGAAKAKASVFIAHGLNDLNVRTIHFGQWWAALPPTVEKKIWLAQTGHVDPFDYRRAVWVETLHAWFDHYLLGVDNGIDRAPQADIERAPGQWTTEPVWPARTTPTTVALNNKVLQPQGDAFTDDPGHDETDWTKGPAKDHVTFTTGPLAADVRISGTPSITVTARSSRPRARLTAILVDLGKTRTRDFTAKGEGVKDLATRSCFGASTPDDSACYLDTTADPLTTTTYVFSRGWADLGHYATRTERHDLRPGTDYSIKFTLATTDHVVPAGHRLELIVAGTDHGLLEPVDGTPEVTVELGRSSLFVPLTGAL